MTASWISNNSLVKGLNLIYEMKSGILFSLFLLGAVSVFPQGKVYRYIVTFKDKGDNLEALENPESFLSRRAVERRERQGLEFDSVDLPVCKEYVDRISSSFRVVGKSRWLNAVMIEMSDRAEADALEQLDFVEGTEWVGTYESEDFSGAYCMKDVTGNVTSDVHGVMQDILSVNGITDMHDEGFTGKNMMIAIIDDGFCNVDEIEGGWSDNIIAVKDFVNGCDDKMFLTGGHGTGVFSCMATNLENMYVGSAPDAGYVLLRSENLNAEEPAEQYYWTFAAEYADSIGVDIINTSLGYNTFDSDFESVTKDRLDGSSVMSRAVDIAVSRGMVVVCAAGNEGRLEWKLITVPADAFDVIAVGGLKDGSKSEKAEFSSIGPTADNRVKPDVMAPGTSYYITTGGYVSSGNGTSYASPIFAGGVACLWEAFPDLSSYEIVDMIRKGGSLYSSPTANMGYGVADVFDIYSENKTTGIESNHVQDIVYCDGNILYVSDGEKYPESSVSVYSVDGRMVHSGSFTGNSYDLSFLNNGIYMVYVKSGCVSHILKIVR